MRNTLLLLVLFSTALQAELIDCITFFPLSDLFINFKMLEEEGYSLRSQNSEDYENSPKANKVLVWNYVLPSVSALFRVQRRVYFLLEPWEPGDSYYGLFSKVYTYNDDLVDGVRFFKIYYPSLMPMDEDLPAFEEKKLCVMVASNMTAPRVEMIRFFETKSAGEFDFYGFYRYDSPLYRGRIPGFHSGRGKIETLKQYRFCICFENSTHLKGYITEKIFCCFAAGCVPVYWGAPNVEAYIPKGCYIDFRDFQDKEELYQYLKAMPQEIYEHYLENIREFLLSAEAQLFSPAYFNEILLDALKGGS